MIVLKCEAENIERLIFAPDGRCLIAPLPGRLQRWDDVAAGGTPVIELGRVEESFSQFTPDGRAMLFGAMRPAIRGVAPNHETVLRFREPFSDWPTMLAVSPDGQHLLAAQWGWNTTPRGRLTCRAMAALEVDVWSLDVDRRFQSLPLFLPDGNRFATIEGWTGVGSEFGPRFVTRDLLSGKVVAVFQQTNHDRDRPYEFPVSSADRRLIAARNAGRIAVYQSEDFSIPPRLIKNDGRKHFTDLAFHPSGRYLAATSNDATVKLYDTMTWEVARTFTWEIGRMRSIAFSPDGTLAAAGSDKGKVVVWDVDV